MLILNYFCTDYNILKGISVIVKVINIVFIIVPILIIVFGMIDYSKAVVSKDEDSLKKATSTLIRRIISGIVVFFVPTLINVFLSFLDTSIGVNVGLAECITNSSNLEYYKELQELREKKEMLELQQKNNQLKNYAIPITGGYGYYTGSEGSHVGISYNLTDEEIKYLAGVGHCEQGNQGAAGVGFEVSLMANRYELQTKYDTVVSYVKNSGWFACSDNYKRHKPTDEEIAVTKEVLVLGQRKLPGYVNDHDCVDCGKSYCSGHKGDICKLVLNGKNLTNISNIKDVKNYVKDKTVLYNIYGGHYTFYAFSSDTCVPDDCDPFGYTEDAKKKYDDLNNSKG